MLREHIPLIAVTTVVALLFYLVFRDVRVLRAGLDAVAAQQVMGPPTAVEMHDDAAKMQLQQLAELQHLQQAQAQAQAQAAQAQAQQQASQAAAATETPGATKAAAKRA